MPATSRAPRLRPAPARRVSDGSAQRECNASTSAPPGLGLSPATAPSPPPCWEKTTRGCVSHLGCVKVSMAVAPSDGKFQIDAPTLASVQRHASCVVPCETPRCLHPSNAACLPASGYRRMSSFGGAYVATCYERTQFLRGPRGGLRPVPDHIRLGAVRARP
jgi:hypothetical protein